MKRAERTDKNKISRYFYFCANVLIRGFDQTPKKTRSSDIKLCVLIIYKSKFVIVALFIKIFVNLNYK